LSQTDLKKQYESFVSAEYTKGYFTGDPAKSAFINYKDDKQFIVKNMRQVLAKITKHTPKGKLLDVGCALGFFVELAREHGFDAYGFDPSEYAVGEAKKLVGEHRIKTGTIGTVRYPAQSFDVITLFDVFEHLQDPGADIERLRTFLKDDGIMVIATGDTDSLMAKVMKRRWTFYIPPQHLFFFSKKTMTILLQARGLTPIEWFRVGKWLSFRYVLHLAQTTGESIVAKYVHKLVTVMKADMFPVYLPVKDNMVAIIKKDKTRV
jgi:SAM-dependent methyltransferase